MLRAEPYVDPWQIWDGTTPCGLRKECSAAGQTDDGLEPGEQCKPAGTAGPLQRLVRPHAADAPAGVAALLRRSMMQLPEFEPAV